MTIFYTGQTSMIYQKKMRLGHFLVKFNNGNLIKDLLQWMTKIIKFVQAKTVVTLCRFTTENWKPRKMLEEQKKVLAFFPPLKR